MVNSKKVDALEFETYSSKTIAKTYKKKKDYKNFGIFIEQYAQLKDSLFKIEERKTQLQLQIRYETAKKEKEIAKQNEQLLEQELKIEKRNLYAILLASILLILAIVFFSIYKRNQLKRRQLQKEIDLKDALATIKTQNKLQEQRLRISRDLHDNIGSQLTFIISSLDNLTFISKNANNKLLEKLTSISSFTSSTIHQLRDTVWAMNKNEITLEDIQSRTLSFVEKAKLATNNVEFEITNNTSKAIVFSSVEGMNIFRVIQEAINNAIKYAKPSQIGITFVEEKSALNIYIKDDGIGFDIQNITLGNGLSNMESRISEIGGKVKIASKTNRGTTIQIICKL